MTNFHNTINANGDTLIAHNITCQTQESKILAIFKESFQSLTPFDVLKIYTKLYRQIPITSIRRAISNLTEENKLIKTNVMRSEEYGKPNFTWKYNSLGK